MATRKLILWQRPMIVVLYAVIPCIISGIYFFGWRALAVLAVTTVFAFFTEWLFVRPLNKPVTSAVFVTSALLGLTLPPPIPLWMAGLGAMAAIAFGKMMLGGFGRNTFNPALVGRCFLYICFPVEMTAQFWLPAQGHGRALRMWAPPYDALTSATPLNLWRDFTRSYDYEPLKLFTGNIGGSIGETSAVAIILGCVILLVTKVASWRTMLSVAIGAISVSGIGYYLGVTRIPDPVFTLLSGGLLFALVFMATDPVSAPHTKAGQWLCGLGIGMLTVILRSFSIFAGAVMFAILIVNMFTPLIDVLVKSWNRRGKEATE